MAVFTGTFFVLHGREEILATETSEDQAREASYWFSDAVWWEYDVLNGRVLGTTPRWDICVPQGPGSLLREK